MAKGKEEIPVGLRSMRGAARNEMKTMLAQAERRGYERGINSVMSIFKKRAKKTA